MNDSVVFEKARQEDLKRVEELHHQGFHVEQGIPEQSIGDFLVREPTIWVARCGGQVAGTIASWREDGVTHLGRLVTDPAFRRMGIGTGLIGTALAELFERGTEEVFSEARDISVKILCAMGGKTVGESRPFFVGSITPVLVRREDFHWE